MSFSERLNNLTKEKKQILAQKLMSLESGSMLKETVVNTQRLVAYVVADELLPPTSDELRALLKSSMPDYMIPHSFFFIDEIPLSPNGKVNIALLPQQSQELTDTLTDFASAENPIEEKLTMIWSSVLGVELIGIHDNFFEIGGDSILSIQIIARSKNEGIHLSPKQIFQNLTIYELAKVARTENINKAEQGLVTGEVPLTPIQHWLLERELPNADYWNQAAMLKMPKDIDLHFLAQAMDYVILQHDVLRSAFSCHDNVWVQNVLSHVSPVAISTTDLSKIQMSEANHLIEAKSNEIQAGVNIVDARVFIAGMFKMPEDTTHDRLFIVIHHLVMDAVSWGTLLEDMQAAYNQLKSGEKVNLPPKTTSYKEWSSAVSVYAQSDELEKEIEYWLSMPNTNVFDIPLDISAGVNDEASEEKYTVSLSKSETQSLLKEIPSVYNTKIDDILLTALAQVITKWTGCSTLSLGMEGHGREQISDDIDLSRSIGWYTSYFPVALKYTKESPGDEIKSIKEQLRSIPNKGIGYAILRYMRNDKALTGKLTEIHQANILYNYLGQFSSHDNTDSLFTFTDESSNHHDLRGPRSHLIEIDSMVMDNQLSLDWVYSKNNHHSKTIEKLANEYIFALRKLILHCQSPESGGFSASDFPEAELAQDDLDDLLATLDD